MHPHIVSMMHVSTLMCFDGAHAYKCKYFVNILKYFANMRTYASTHSEYDAREHADVF